MQLPARAVAYEAAVAAAADVAVEVAAAAAVACVAVEVAGAAEAVEAVAAAVVVCEVVEVAGAAPRLASARGRLCLARRRSPFATFAWCFSRIRDR